MEYAAEEYGRSRHIQLFDLGISCENVPAPISARRKCETGAELYSLLGGRRGNDVGDGLRASWSFHMMRAAAFCDVSDGWIYRHEARRCESSRETRASENI